MQPTYEPPQTTGFSDVAQAEANHQAAAPPPVGGGFDNYEDDDIPF